MASTTWRVAEDLYERLRTEAFRRRTSVNQLITAAVREWLDRHGGKKGA